jgi:PAS domain S-box-containing protein
VAISPAKSPFAPPPRRRRSRVANQQTRRVVKARGKNRSALAREQHLRKAAEASETRTKEELAAELEAMTRLHELSTRLLTTDELQPLLAEVLTATVAIQNSDFGTVQLYHPNIRKLEIVAHQGFDPDLITQFTLVDETSASSCGRALKTHRRVVVNDVQKDPESASHREAAAALGYRAQQSTPLFGRNGEVLGMISTHFRKPHRLLERELRFTDLYARQAAEVIQRKQAEEAVRESQAKFRRCFELGLIGMAMTSPTNGILEVNDELCRILGYDRAELLQKTWGEMTHPEDLAADVAQFHRVMAGDIDGYSLEKRWIRKDGRIIYSLMSAKCQRGSDGAVDYFVGLLLDITERKRVEERLQEYEKAMEGLDEMIVVVDREYRYRVANRAFLSYRGLEREKLEGRLIPDLLNQGVWENVSRKKLDQALRGDVVKYELTYDYPQAGERDLLISYFPIQGPSGIDRVACVMQDITERKRAEDARHKLAALVDNSSDFIGLATIEGKVLYVNQAGRKLVGLDGLGSTSIWDYVMEEDRPFVSEHVLSQVMTRGSWEGKIAMRNFQTGASIQMHGNVFIIKDEATNRPLALATISRDITELEQAEKELRRSEAHLAEAQRIGHIGSWIWNVETGECLWSHEHFRLFGLDPETFKPTKENTQRFIHPEDLGVVEQTLERAAAEKTDFDLEYRIIRPDGAIRYHHGSGRPVARGNGQLEFIGMVVDVTERKQAEKALQTAQSKLQKVTHVSAMGEMAAAIAHEINQPLGAIVNNSNYCLQLIGKPDNENKRRAALNDIVNDANRASAIIGRIRALTNGSIPEIAKLNFPQLIAEVVSLAHRGLAEHRIELTTNVARNLPSILGDRVHLQQVLLNLVVNAIEAMSSIEDARRLTIRVERTRLDGDAAILVRVEDTGTGFEPETAERMFDAFYSTKAQGMGMGLRISRSIIEGHGGQLSAEQNEDKGATFSFVLPARNGHV